MVTSRFRLLEADTWNLANASKNEVFASLMIYVSKAYDSRMKKPTYNVNGLTD